jgi:hypothetical protein
VSVNGLLSSLSPGATGPDERLGSMFLNEQRAS